MTDDTNSSVPADDDELPRAWYVYDEGRSQGQTGPDGGVVIRDEEYGDPDDTEDADARVTLERLDTGAFALTVNLYGGWMYHTFALATEADGGRAFDSAKPELVRLAGMLPYEEDGPKRVEEKVRALEEAAAKFTASTL